MATKLVRLGEDDLERIHHLSGMPKSAPLSRKLQALFLRLEDTELNLMRLALREELERAWGGT